MGARQHPILNHPAQILGDKFGRAAGDVSQLFDGPEGFARHGLLVPPAAAHPPAQAAAAAQQDDTQHQQGQEHAQPQAGEQLGPAQRQGEDPHHQHGGEYDAQAQCAEHGEQHARRAARQLILALNNRLRPHGRGRRGRPGPGRLRGDGPLGRHRPLLRLRRRRWVGIRVGIGVRVASVTTRLGVPRGRRHRPRRRHAGLESGLEILRQILGGGLDGGFQVVEFLHIHHGHDRILDLPAQILEFIKIVLAHCHFPHSIR